MFYWHLEKIGMQEYDFGTFFKEKAECLAAIVDTSHDNAGAIVGIKSMNELSLRETFQSGFLHYVDVGEVCNVRFRVDKIAFSPLSHERSFVVTGHVDESDWRGTVPDLRSYKDIGYRPPSIVPHFDFFFHL